MVAHPWFSAVLPCSKSACSGDVDQRLVGASAPLPGLSSDAGLVPRAGGELPRVRGAAGGAAGHHPGRPARQRRGIRCARHTLPPSIFKLNCQLPYWQLCCCQE